MSHTVIIGIAGASGSGKTLLATNLADRLGTNRTLIIQEDAYYRDLADIPAHERAVQNFDHPDAFEHILLVTHLQHLLNQEKTSLPVYDYKTHLRLHESRAAEPHEIIIVEGILVLSVPQLRELMDIRVFVDTPVDVCLTRRLKRDVAERGRSHASVMRQYRETVEPMYCQFIEPSRSHADVLIPRGGKNRDAMDLLATRIDDRLQNNRP